MAVSDRPGQHLRTQTSGLNHASSAPSEQRIPQEVEQQAGRRSCNARRLPTGSGVRLEPAATVCDDPAEHQRWSQIQGYLDVRAVRDDPFAASELGLPSEALDGVLGLQQEPRAWKSPPGPPDATKLRHAGVQSKQARRPSHRVCGAVIEW